MDEAARQIEPLIPALRRYAFALARNHEAADDLVQDCLERALSRWLLRRRDAGLRAWLFTILRNLYIDDYRRRRRHGPHAPIDELNSPWVEPSQEAGLGLRDLMAALDSLPEEQKSLLLLVGVEDLSYEETARVLDIPLGTVMSRLSRARAKLRSVLEAGLETGRVSFLRRVK